jgi:hypothetical protein
MFDKKLLFLAIMRRVIVIIFALILCSGIAKGGGVPGFRTEFGVVAGVNYLNTKFDMGDSTAALKVEPGFTAGVHLGLRLASIFGIEPQVLYSYNKIALNDEKQNFTTDIKCNTVQVPVMFSFKLAILKFNIGPVFTVMDNPTYLDRKSEKVMFGTLHPTISYAAGVSVTLLRHLMIDARVSSGFKSVENFLSYDAKMQGHTIKSSTINAQLKVGFLF